LPPHINYWSSTINIRNGFSRITLKNGVGDFPDLSCLFFYTLRKFVIFNADVSFDKRGHNFKMEAKLNKARQLFLKEVFWNMPANFQPILSEDMRKRTKNIHPCVQFF